MSSCRAYRVCTCRVSTSECVRFYAWVLGAHREKVEWREITRQRKGKGWETTRQRKGKESDGRLSDREKGEWWETTRQGKGRGWETFREEKSGGRLPDRERGRLETTRQKIGEVGDNRQRKGRVVGDYQTDKGERVGDYQTEKGESGCRLPDRERERGGRLPDREWEGERGGRLPDREELEWWETTRGRKERGEGDFQTDKRERVGDYQTDKRARVGDYQTDKRERMGDYQTEKGERVGDYQAEKGERVWDCGLPGIWRADALSWSVVHCIAHLLASFWSTGCHLCWSHITPFSSSPLSPPSLVAVLPNICIHCRRLYRSPHHHIYV